MPLIPNLRPARWPIAAMGLLGGMLGYIVFREFACTTGCPAQSGPELYIGFGIALGVVANMLR